MAAEAPPIWPDDPLPDLARRAAARPLAVLDDDPTGTQTLRDVPVLTGWDADTVARHLGEPVVFLSTNSRALERDAAVATTRDAASTVRDASRSAGRLVSIVSRSDSTLRGHFPDEPLAVAAAIGELDARILVAPYFGEGARRTADDVHLLEVDGRPVPVGETEFARDPSFGYRSSNLRGWVAEKYRASGGIPPPIGSLSLELIRQGGPTAVAAAIAATEPGGVAIANATVDRDIEVVALGALLAEEAGVPIVPRVAASYVRARAGRGPAPLLTADELRTDGPGLIVVGSHVDTTTRQLQRLLESTKDRVTAHEIPIDRLIAGGSGAAAVVLDAAAGLESALARGRIGLVATERTRRDVGLPGARAISDALVAILRRVERRPGWVLAKGGITSSDIASRALEMREARAIGQMLLGVPVWVGGEGTRWPGMPLVVFPGNVGDDGALLRAVDLLGGS